MNFKQRENIMLETYENTDVDDINTFLLCELSDKIQKQISGEYVQDLLSDIIYKLNVADEKELEKINKFLEKIQK